MALTPWTNLLAELSGGSDWRKYRANRRTGALAVFCILLLLIPAPSRAEQDGLGSWAVRHAIPFELVGSDVPGLDSLTLAELFGTAKIVGLGEGTHGTSEFFRMKTALVKRLVTDFGFTAFAIEANLPEARAVNAFIMGGDIDPGTAIRGMHFWTWSTEEVLDLVLWLRAYNDQAERKVEFWGFDAQYATAAIDSVLSFYEAVDPETARLLEGYYEDIEDTTIRTYSLLRTRRAQEALEVIHQSRDDLPEDVTDLAHNLITRFAHIVVQSCKVFLSHTARDSAMADNVDWIRTQGHDKIVLWAHNSHVSRHQSRQTTMGYYLDKEHGSDYLPVAFTQHSGTFTAYGESGLATQETQIPPADSFEAIFHQTGIPTFILDLRHLEGGLREQQRPLRRVGSTIIPMQFWHQRIADDFDLLIYFDHGSASRLLKP